MPVSPGSKAVKACRAVRASFRRAGNCSNRSTSCRLRSCARRSTARRSTWPARRCRCWAICRPSCPTSGTTRPCRCRAMESPMLPVVEAPLHQIDASLAIDAALAERWLVAFLRDELIERRRITKAVLGLSCGIDSAVVAYLCARALGPENVYAIRMPYRTSSADSLADAQHVADALGINLDTIEIPDAVEGYLRAAHDPDPRRRG